MCFVPTVLVPRYCPNWEILAHAFSVPSFLNSASFDHHALFLNMAEKEEQALEEVVCLKIRVEL